jgi:hypothetical protein
MTISSFVRTLTTYFVVVAFAASGTMKVRCGMSSLATRRR